MKDQLPRLTGIPIKERSPEDVRATFAGEDPEIADKFIRLHAYACKEHLGITSLSHQTNIPAGVLSQAFNHSYPGDYSALAERIDKFFWRLDQKQLYGGLRQFVETRLAQSLWAVFEKTRIIRRIQIIRSPEQLGKTRAAEEYTARNNSGRTVYIRLSGGTRHGAGDFIWNLAESLGIPYSVKLREKRIRIRQAIEACDLVIIDEAHLVWSWVDSAARDFWDYLRTDIFADGERGVVLISTHSDMLTELGLFRRRARYNVGQLLGRMRNETIEIDPAEDIVAEDVEKLMARYYQPGREAVRVLHALAQREQLGHFGLVDDILNESWTRAKAAKRPLSDAAVIETAREIIKSIEARHKSMSL